MAWAPDYVTLAKQKHYMRIDIDDTDDDAEIGTAVTAASRAIDDHCNRQFGNLAGQRLYTAWPDYERGRWVVDIADLQTAAGLVVTVTGVGIVTAYDLEPVNAVVEGMAWTRLSIKQDSAVQPCGAPNEMAITANPWGWTAVPVPVEQAEYLQASRFASRRNSPYGIAGSPDQGSEMRLLARVDPDVGVSLRKYRRARKVG